MFIMFIIFIGVCHETVGFGAWEKPAIAIAPSRCPSIMNTNGNDLVLCVADVVVVVELKFVVVGNAPTCDVAAVEAVVSAFADGVLRLAHARGLLD